MDEQSLKFFGKMTMKHEIDYLLASLKDGSFDSVTLAIGCLRAASYAKKEKISKLYFACIESTDSIHKAIKMIEDCDSDAGIAVSILEKIKNDLAEQA